MDKSQVLVCPACGEKNIERIEKESSDQLTMGPKFFFKEIYYRCHACESEIDILNETDQYYLKAKKEAKDISVKEIIESLHNSGISMSFFELVFELPFRTLTRWKKGDHSAAALALLRIVKTFPWIAVVAEQRFSQMSARAIMLHEADKIKAHAPIESSADNITETFDFKSKSSYQPTIIQGG
jgi:DNA-binding transcriptional regulator YiaG